MALPVHEQAHTDACQQAKCASPTLDQGGEPGSGAAEGTNCSFACSLKLFCASVLRQIQIAARIQGLSHRRHQKQQAESGMDGMDAGENS